MGYHAVLMLSGGTQRQDLCNLVFRPDLVLEFVAEQAGPARSLSALFGNRSRDEDTITDFDSWRAAQLA